DDFSRNSEFLNICKTFESLSTEIKVLSAKIKAIMSPDISNISITTGSPYSVKTSQSPVVPISPKLPPIATFIEAANDDVNQSEIV
ncbi:unnamed protein product, partial [Hymenolepis diminuta]